MFFIVQAYINPVIDFLLPVWPLAIDNRQQTISRQEKKEFLQWDIVSQKYKNKSSILDIL